MLQWVECCHLNIYTNPFRFYSIFNQFLFIIAFFIPFLSCGIFPNNPLEKKSLIDLNVKGNYIKSRDSGQRGNTQQSRHHYSLLMTGFSLTMMTYCDLIHIH